MKVRFFPITILLVFASILAACTKNSAPVASSTAEPAAAAPSVAETTRPVNTLRGTVNIPADPKRIADASGVSDMLYIIGRKPVATSDSDAYDYTKFPSYLADILAGAVIIGYPMSDTVDVEAVLAVEPDLIIINPRQEKVYDQLNAIATTIVIEPNVNDWRGDLRMVAGIFGAADTAEQFIASYAEKAAAAGRAIQAANGEDATYFSFLTGGSSYYLFTGAAYGDIFYNDFGLKAPVNLPAQDSITLPTATLEGLTDINADYIVALASPDDQALLEGSAVWNSFSAVKNKHVIWLPQSPYFNEAYSVYGRFALVDELQRLLTE
jgi:iron complex transport system substrate-binding protein